MKLDSRKSDFLFVFFIFISSLGFCQNKCHLEINLKNLRNSVFIEVKNITSDTITLFTKLKVENKNIGAYIIGYKKQGENYKRGGLKECYDCLMEYLYLGNIEKNRIKIPPHTYITTFLPYLYNGEYFFEIYTFYIYKKEKYTLSIKTNKLILSEY